MAQQTLLGGDGVTGETGANHNSKANSNFTELYTATSTAQSTADAANTAVSTHVSDSSAAHAGSAISFTPAGGLSSTDVQAAIVELAGAGGVADASETVKGIVELATPAEVITGSDAVRSVTPAGLHGKVVGVEDLFIPAAAFWPTITNGCSSLTQSGISTVNIKTLDFDQTTQQFAQCQIVLQRKWNNGTVTAVIYWTATDAGSGGVQWGVSGAAFRDDDALSAALGTAQTVDDTLLATNDLHITSATSAITLSGTLQDANFLVFQVSRNPAAGADTLPANARFLGISLRITTDAAKDA